MIGLIEGMDTILMAAAQSNGNLETIPYAAYGFGVIFNLCGNAYHETCLYSKVELNFDVMTISQILDGDIQYWDDARILAHNPNLKVALPHQQIVVVKPNQDEYYSKFETLVRRVNPSFSYKGATVIAAEIDDAKLEVIDRRYSFSYTPIYGSFEDLIKLGSIKNSQGSYVAPTSTNIQLCGTDTFDSKTMKFDLLSSMDPNCYPLVEMIYIVTPVQYSECTKDIQATVLYLQWLIKGNGNAAHSHDLIHHPAVNYTLTSQDSSYLGDTDDLELPLQHNHFGSMFYLKVKGSGYRSDGTTLQIRITEQLERIKCGTKQMLMKHAELGLIPQEVVYIMYAVAGICVSVCVGLATWVFINKKKKLIRNSSPIFMYEILFGATLSLISIFPMGMQDDTFNFHDPSFNKDWSRLDMACRAMPFLYSVGFSISFSALFVKTWRMVKLFNNRRFKRLKITDWMLLKYQVLIIGVIVLYNIGWLVIDPLYWKRMPVAVSDSGEVAESSGICVMNGDIYLALGPLMGIMILMLTVGNYYSYKGRFIPSEYAESKWVGFSMLLYLEALIIGVPVVILSSGNAGASFIVKGLAIVLADFGTVLLIFIPKIWLLYGWGIEGQSSMNKEDSTGNSGSKTGKKGATNSRTHSRENVGSTNPPTLLSSKSVADMKVFSLSSMSLSNLGDVSSATNSKVALNEPVIKLMAKTTTKGNEREIPVEIFSKVYPSLHEALQEEEVRIGLIDYAAPKYFDEPVRFYSDVIDFQTTKNHDIRARKAVNIIKKYILPESPLELHLSAPLRAKYERILAVYEKEVEDAKGNHGGWFSSMFSSSSSTSKAADKVQNNVIIPRKDDSTPPVESAKRIKSKQAMPTAEERSAHDQMIDLEFFQTVQKIVIVEMQSNRKQWKEIITFIKDSSISGNYQQGEEADSIVVTSNGKINDGDMQKSKAKDSQVSLA